MPSFFNASAHRAPRRCTPPRRFRGETPFVGPLATDRHPVSGATPGIPRPCHSARAGAMPHSQDPGAVAGHVHSAVTRTENVHELGIGPRGTHLYASLNADAEVRDAPLDGNHDRSVAPCSSNFVPIPHRHPVSTASRMPCRCAGQVVNQRFRTGCSRWMDTPGSPGGACHRRILDMRSIANGIVVDSAR